MDSNVKYRNGEVVFEESSGGKEVYFILDGKVEVSRRIAGRKRIISILDKDDFFGEMSAVTGHVRSMTITAIGDLSLYKLSLKEMLEYMQREPEILGYVFTDLVMRLRNTNSMLEEITLKALTNGEEEGWTAENDDFGKLSILVVDDHPNILTVLETLLSHEYNVFTASDGQEALEIMELNDIALVLADYRMPGMTGIELLEKVKEINPDTIRIIISANFDQGVLMKAIRKVQAHEVLPKPWRNAELTFTVTRWIEQYKKTRWLKEKASQHIAVKRQLEETDKLVDKLVQKKREEIITSPARTPFWRRKAQIMH